MKTRKKTTVTAAQREEYETQMLERYGSLEKQLMDLAAAIIHPLLYGIIPTDEDRHGRSASRVPRHRYSTEFLNGDHTGNSRPHPLPQYRIRQHFLAADKRGFLWYTNACPMVTTDEGEMVLLALLKVDVDCHRGESDADEAMILLREKLTFPLYVETSTNGKGRHGYVMVSYPVNYHLPMIRGHIESFQQWVSAMSDRRITEVRGSPCDVLMDSKGLMRVGTRGSLAKFPRVQSYEEAAEFLTVVSSPIQFSDLPTIPEAAPSSPLSPPPSSTCSNYGQSKIGESLTPLPPPSSSTCSNCGQSKIEKSPLSRSSHPDWTAIKTDSPPRRATMLVAHLYHELRREPTLAEAQDEYVAKGLNSGADADGNRAVLLQDAIDYFRNRWKHKTLDYFAYAAALKGIVPKNEMQSSDRLAITFEDLSVAYTLIKSQIERGRTWAEVSQELAIAVWAGLRKQGYDQTFRRTRWAAMKNILIRHGLVQRVRTGKKYKGCDAFILGTPLPLVTP